MPSQELSRVTRLAEQRAAAKLLRGGLSPDVITNDPDGYIYDLITGQVPGYSVSSNPLSYVDRALPAFMRATQLISDTIAGLPWRLIKGRDTLDPPKWVTDPQLLRPDGRLGVPFRFPTSLNRMDFWAQLIVSMLWTGNGFLWSAADSYEGGPKPGWPFLKVLNPAHVSFDWNNGYTIDGESVEKSLGGRLIHFRGLPPYDEYGFGVGVLQRHAADLDLAYQVRQYASDTFNSGVPSGYLQVTSQNLDKTQADALKSKWLEAHGNRRTIAVLNATTQFHPLSISPLDAQLIEQKKMTVQDIALMFGLDPTFLGAPSGDSATYANVESRQIIFTQTTLTPWVRRIEETLSAEFPDGTFIEVDMRGLLRGDNDTRREWYSTALDKGWMTVDEVRSIERLPVLPNEPLPANPEWPGRGDELPPGPQFTDSHVTPEQFTEEGNSKRLTPSAAQEVSA